MARISCRSRLVSDARRRYAARKGRFSRPMPLRERMKRKSRHGSPPENAPRHNLATTGPPRKHIAARSCHCRTLGNAFREHFAIGERPGMHLGGILPRPAPRGRMASICCHGRVFRGYAAEICCRCLSERHWRAAAMKEPGVPEGPSVPPPRLGHLRCTRPWCMRRSVFGKWGHCAACAVPCASQRPHRRGARPFSAA